MIQEKLSLEERQELLAEISKLFENVYICLSHSENKTLPLIKSLEFIPEGQFSKYIWIKLIEVKKDIEHLKKQGFHNIPKYVQTEHESILSSQIPDSVSGDIKNFRIISQALIQHSAIWDSSVITYLLASDVLEKIIVFRDKIANPDNFQRGIWRALKLKGHFKYYSGYNRIKLLTKHDTFIERENKKYWWQLSYLDYNISDVRHILKTTAFGYFTIDPNTELLSFYFSTLGRINSVIPKGPYVSISITDFYDYTHEIFMENESFFKCFRCSPTDLEINKTDNYFVFLCRADITKNIHCYDVHKCSEHEFKTRGFDSLLRFRKVLPIKSKRDMVESKYSEERENKIYYIPSWFHDCRNAFLDYIQNKISGMDILKIMPILPKIRFYFSIYPDSLRLYREECTISTLHSYWMDSLKPIKISPTMQYYQKISEQEDFKDYIPVRVYDGNPSNIEVILSQIIDTIKKSEPLTIHVIQDVMEDIKIADGIISRFSMFKFPKEGKFLWERNYTFGNLRRAIYKYIYKDKRNT